MAVVQVDPHRSKRRERPAPLTSEEAKRIQERLERAIRIRAGEERPPAKPTTTPGHGFPEDWVTWDEDRCAWKSESDGGAVKIWEPKKNHWIDSADWCKRV